MFKGQSSGETGVMQRVVFRNQLEGKKSAAGSITVDTVAPSCQMSRAVVVVTACDSNHQTRHAIALDRPICTSGLRIELLDTNGNAPAALLDVRCYLDD